MGRTLDERDFWLIDSLVVAASLHDLDGRFVYMNPGGRARRSAVRNEIDTS